MQCIHTFHQQTIIQKNYKFINNSTESRRWHRKVAVRVSAKLFNEKSVEFISWFSYNDQHFSTDKPRTALRDVLNATIHTKKKNPICVCIALTPQEPVGHPSIQTKTWNVKTAQLLARSTYHSVFLLQQFFFLRILNHCIATYAPPTERWPTDDIAPCILLLSLHAYVRVLHIRHNCITVSIIWQWQWQCYHLWTTLLYMRRKEKILVCAIAMRDNTTDSVLFQSVPTMFRRAREIYIRRWQYVPAPAYHELK